MKVNTSNPLPWVLVIVAVFWSWQLNVLAHETCNNEQRYENQVMCEGKEFGCLVPYPDNCSLFLVCDCLYPTVKVCPAHLWWDNKTQLCNYPQQVDCVYYSIETPEPTDGTTQITPGSTETTTKISPNITDNTSTTKVTFTTPSQTWPTSSWDPPPAPPGISEDYCKNQKDGSVHRYPYDCQAYINCTSGWPVLNYCDPDKVFNELLEICDTPEVSDCEELPLPTSTTEVTTISTTEKTPTSTTELTPTSTTEEDVVCGPSPENIPEDYCEPLGNGFYEYFYNCSGYLACRNGCTDLDYCQPDKLFNNLLHICDTPDSVPCDPMPYPTTPGVTEKPTTLTTPTTIRTTTSEGNDSTTSTAITTETIPTTTTGLPADVDPNDCKGLPDGTIIAYAGNCSQYLICKNDQVQMGECPPTLLFNPIWLVCDEPGDFTCLGDLTTTPIPTTKQTTTTEQTTPSPTTTSTQATTLGPTELCEGQPLGTSFAYPEDCKKYYLCMGDGGKWLVATCIYGSYFDPSSGECGPDVSPDACRPVESTTTTTTVATTTTERITSPKTTSAVPSTTQKIPTTTEAPSTGVCAGRDENENIAYPKNCNKYIVCVSPIPIAFYCPDETFFSSKLGKCIGSWEDSDCEGDQSTTTAEPGITRPPPEPTMCTNSTRDTFPYPENCQWFIRCVDDYIFMMDVCNCGEYYDPISEKCGADVPSDACRWDYSSTTSTTKEPTTTSPVTRPPPQKGPCDDVDDGALVPYPNDCSKYIKCSRPIAEAFDCDEGDEFSVALEQCVEASLANCSITTTSKPSEGTTTPSGGDSTSTSPESTTVNPTTPPTKSTTISTTEFTTESSIETTSVTPTESTTLSTTQPSTVTSTENPTESSTLSTTESTSTETPTESTTIYTTYEPESSSTEPGTTTANPGGGVCGGKTDDSLVPYPRNCSKYIVCQYPIPVGYDCPIGLEFSPTELTCMDPELAGCSPTLTTTEKPTTAASTTPSTTESTTLSTTTESTTISTTAKTTTESTTVATTPRTTIESTTTDSTTVSTTPRTTSESTTVSTTIESTTDFTTSEATSELTTVSTAKTTTESTTVSTTPKSTSESTTVSTTPKSTSESTTVSTTTESTTAASTPMTTIESTTTDSTTVSTTPRTTSESTTVSTTTESTTDSTTSEATSESTTVPTTPKTTTESTTVSTTPKTTTEVPPITLDPYTPNICCGQPLGTLLAYPNDCSRYVVCDYPIPYSVDCDEGTVFDDKLLQCTATPNERCLFIQI